ncbi:MAG TPA: hypothetical protein VNA88_19370 [Candidatus Kapabacteria bacterium]|nr:hypothetical protein [Candidatus Kapabacteria bacterium]
MNDFGSAIPASTSPRNGTRPVPGPRELRRRNRRVGILLAVAFVTLVALCAAYIYWYGGSNKPPMKPFHVSRTAIESPRTA